MRWRNGDGPWCCFRSADGPMPPPSKPIRIIGFGSANSDEFVGYRVLAVEAAEGTDAMLDRVAAMREAGRTAHAPGVGVLVKAPKRRQDRRFDLPSIGPDTVARTARAGLAGIAVIAGATIVAEPQRLVEAADGAGLFVVGRPDPEKRA